MTDHPENGCQERLPGADRRRRRRVPEKLEEDLLHVVISDVKMPGMDGVETLRTIERRFSLVAVIMLTGHAMTAALKKSQF